MKLPQGRGQTLEYSRISARALSASHCSFSGLMELYEANYLRLRTLIGDVRHARGWLVSEVPNCMSLHVRVLETGAYTSMLVLTYEFPPGSELTTEPDLRIQVYHDARVAEVVGRSSRAGRYTREAGESLYDRWRRNRFLYRWLGYCLTRGHRFQVTAASGSLDLDYV